MNKLLVLIWCFFGTILHAEEKKLFSRTKINDTGDYLNYRVYYSGGTGCPYQLGYSPKVKIETNENHGKIIIDFNSYSMPHLGFKNLNTISTFPILYMIDCYVRMEVKIPLKKYVHFRSFKMKGNVNTENTTFDLQAFLRMPLYYNIKRVFSMESHLTSDNLIDKKIKSSDNNCGDMEELLYWSITTQIQRLSGPKIEGSNDQLTLNKLEIEFDVQDCMPKL